VLVRCIAIIIAFVVAILLAATNESAQLAESKKREKASNVCTKVCCTGCVESLLWLECSRGG